MDDVLLDVAFDTPPETADFADDTPTPNRLTATVEALKNGDLTVEHLRARMFGPDSTLNRPGHCHLLS